MTLFHNDRRDFLSDGTKMLVLGSTAMITVVTTTTSSSCCDAYDNTATVQLNSNALESSLETLSPPPSSTTTESRSSSSLRETTTPSPSSTVTVPLSYTGQELLVTYQVDGSKFRAVLDTGSPFLMIPGSCGSNTRARSGCYLQQGRPTGLQNTIEIFSGFEGDVEWRVGSFEFVDVILSNTDTSEASSMLSQRHPSPPPPPLIFGRPMPRHTATNTDDDGDNNSIKSDDSVALPTDRDVIFGVASEDIMTGPGGVFFGMIRDTDRRIRPSFLGQTNVKSFQVDMKSRPRTLTLSTTSIITSDTNKNFTIQSSNNKPPAYHHYVPLSDLLRTRYGDPVQHYTIRAKSMEVNGHTLVSDDESTRSRPLLVIIDTGVTGMVVSRDLFNQQYDNARRRKDKNLFGTVSLSFDTRRISSTKKNNDNNLGSSPSSSQGLALIPIPTSQDSNDVITLSAVKPLATPFDPEQSWTKFNRRNANNGLQPPHLIVLGLAFLEDHTITIDIDEQRLWVA